MRECEEVTYAAGRADPPPQDPSNADHRQSVGAEAEEARQGGERVAVQADGAVGRDVSGRAQPSDAPAAQEGHALRRPPGLGYPDRGNAAAAGGTGL